MQYRESKGRLLASCGMAPLPPLKSLYAINSKIQYRELFPRRPRMTAFGMADFSEWRPFGMAGRHPHGNEKSWSTSGMRKSTESWRNVWGFLSVWKSWRRELKRMELIGTKMKYRTKTWPCKVTKWHCDCMFDCCFVFFSIFHMLIAGKTVWHNLSYML